MAAKQALEGTRLNAFGMDPSALTIIGLDTKDGPEHPLYDERVRLPLDENMVKNVMKFGVLETILVRKDGEAVEVVDGKQRTRLAREANIRLQAQGCEPIKVPVMVKRGQDGEMYGILISANEVRRDDSPLVKAQKLNKYLNMGYTEEAAAVAFGVTKTAIQSWAKLLQLDDKVANAVDAGQISASAAGKLADLSREEQRKALDTLIAAGATSSASAKQLADAAKEEAAKSKNGEGEKKDGEKKRPKTGLRKKNSKGRDRKTLKALLKECHGVKGVSDDAVLVLEWALGYQDDATLAKHVKGMDKALAALKAAVK